MIISIGDKVQLTGNHPFAGHFGEFGNLNTGRKFKRPKIRVFEMGDHEVYAMKDSQIRIVSRGAK